MTITELLTAIDALNETACAAISDLIIAHADLINDASPADLIMIREAIEDDHSPCLIDTINDNCDINFE